jgi:hypothetical protein
MPIGSSAISHSLRCLRRSARRQLTKRSPQPRLPKKRRRPEESPRKGRRKSRFELRTSNLELRRSQIPHALVLRRVRIMVCSRCNQAAGDYWYSSASSAPPSAQVRPRCSPRALPAAACMQSSPIRAYLSTVRTVRSRESRIHKEVDLFSVLALLAVSQSRSSTAT